MRQGAMQRYYLFSPWLRIFHWVMVICVFILFVTGLYIGNPFFLGNQGIDPTFAVANGLSMETIRYIHFIAAYILVLSFIPRIYGFIINPGDRLLPRFWTKLYWTGIMDTQLHYMFLRGRHRPYLRNSLARSGYLAVYFMFLIEMITGFAMYYMVEPNRLLAKIFGPFNNLLVNEYVVHLIHHFVAWFIILFVIVHVYMAVRADFTEKGGEISAMFSGVKYLEEEPDDVGDILVKKAKAE
ncbi:Ni/Fe-hydrogenase, b-type cytochrome subunit [Sporomusa acidovorans]|uniref:Quinone-reactive Ni/Fe-hydrogenase B-type cytochrome subunit n=1 Tax=Sporomusa acidovorans (strain ATCC 49682 / DSM 3132 / Mol) TaxID=1123286 RepID=A0ABZ3J1G6_SPOA4|nr:Ni/Fe-hydrogenase, b-type cytochrome subunit [Sporomusa acidovorans]OZC15000.1 quinone-reactive Ni/Fe-hydrogenase B-type cytochrome subunit [Sporomusa acidovorans DSM 3132]SDE83721.1 Ni/Fe-hydrogenase 1 B-type cytochrome subunit [Sporomusa acidovorans]